VRAAQLLDNCRRLQNAILIALQQRHDLGVPDVGERVLASPPVSWLLRLRRQRACLPSVGATPLIPAAAAAASTVFPTAIFSLKS
jgi:hypothetical protein